LVALQKPEPREVFHRVAQLGDRGGVGDDGGPMEDAAMKDFRRRTSATGSVPSRDGVTIRYEDAGRGDPAIVFVHGWSCDRSYWTPQIQHFSKSHRTVSVDLGGHGESGLGRGDWTMTAFGADVTAVLNALDVRNVVLVGHSMGGPVIVETALLVPGRVAALVSVDHFADVDGPMSAADRERQLARLRDDFRGATETWVRTFFPPDADPLLVDDIVHDMASAPSGVGVSALDHVRRYDEAAALARTPVPMRMINSDLWPTNLDAARRHKPDIELAMMTGVGHFPHLEAPDRFNALLARAIRDLGRESNF
jgi:pimeloyl-ACP methyl ester carboxylesterase